ncbi:MAG: carbohydrate binding family 9 domain-containing protein [Melioribacteraceae bacterium]|nr:carbohydrate binding family 9 domain-containing protein [Melioribacteraceae bacterium]
MKKVLLILFLIPLIITTTMAKGQAPKEKEFKASKVLSKINVDGKLDEQVWKKMPVSGFTQRDPEEGKPASEKTEVWVAYDEANIYVAAKMYDVDPDKIDRSLARRDSWMESDWFFFEVDPYLDRRTGYFFAVNPGGSLLDGTFFNDGWDDDSWDGIWDVKTNIDSEGWTVEMKIPFAQLRFNKSEDMTWGVNFVRKIKRKKENSFYVMVPKKESGYISHFAEMNNLTGIEPKQRLEVLPYYVQKAQYLVHDIEDPFYEGNQYKNSFGADLKVGIGSNLNLDMTINPDFGQVEVDPAELNLTAFETFFQEKRPFFIEGQNIFMFGHGGANNNWGFNFSIPDIFYSRRIGRSPQGENEHEGYSDRPSETRILGAAKLTGKIAENWSVGALSAVTERTFSITDSSGVRFKDQIEPFTHYGVFRTRGEFNKGKQALGFIATAVNRDLNSDNLSSFLTKEAYTFGMDGWTFLDEDEEYVITGNIIGSYVSGSKEAITNLQERSYRYMQRPDATYAILDENRTNLSGWFSRIMFNKQKGNIRINAALGAASPTFENNDLGFQWLADRLNGHVVFTYRWFEPDSTLFRSKTLNLAYNQSRDFEGNIQRNGLYFSGYGQFLNYYSSEFSFSYNAESFSKTLARGGPLVKMPSNINARLGFYSDSREKFIASIEGFHWNDFEGSKDYGLEFGLEWKPNTQLNVSISPEYSYEYATYQWVGNFEDAVSTTYGNRYVFGEMKRETYSANIRVNWTFTSKLSLQAFIQPFLSVGHYSDFHELAEASTFNFNNFTDVSFDSENEEYTINPEDGGSEFTFSNPDFNFKSFRANVVLRWEVLPGSVFYFAWTHDQMNFDDPGRMDFKNDFSNLFREEADDVFLVKFSYWWDY